MTDLRQAYESAWREITDELQRIALDPRTSRRRVRLRELQGMVEERLDALDSQAKAWFDDSLPIVYRDGADRAAELLDEPFRWTTADHTAVTAMAQDGFEDLLAATENVRESLKAVIRRLARERALLGRLEGETAIQSARRLRRLLQDQGVTAVVYADGSRHGLADYADMVIRTKTALAYSTAGVNISRRAGVTFMECFDGPGCGLVSHDDGEKPNGGVYPIDIAAAYSIAHPRCQRVWSPRPDITTADDAATAKPSTTAEQRADQVDQEAQREQATRERANRGAAQQRAATRRAAAAAAR